MSKQLLVKALCEQIRQLIRACDMLDHDSLFFSDVTFEKMVTQIDVLGPCSHLWCVCDLNAPHAIFEYSGFDVGIGDFDIQHIRNFLDETT